MENKSRTIEIPMQLRVAEVQPKSLNEEERTVEIIWTTGQRVRRQSFFDGPFIEELGLKKSEVRMKRLKDKAPFLDSHGFGEKRGVRNVLGVIEDAELIPEKQGRAIVRFSKRPDVEDVFQDVRDGILTKVSVGYNILRMEKVGEENEVPIFRATDWEPVEVSLVAAGADSDAHIRSSNQGEKYSCEIIDNETENNNNNIIRESGEEENQISNPDLERDTNPIGDQDMEPNKTENQTEANPTVNVDEVKREAALAEKQRSKDIRSIVQKVGLAIELADQYIDDNKSVEEVRTLVIDKIAEDQRSPENNTSSVNQISVGKDNAREHRVKGMTNAILHRFRPQTEESYEGGQKSVMKGFALEEHGREFAYLSLLDMARFCLEANGVRTGGIPVHRLADMVLERGGLHSTSDFVEILANVVNKTLRNGYIAAPQTFQPFTREVFVNDFKQISRTNLGDAEKLEKLSEGAKVRRGTIGEAAEKYFVEEYAKIISITRKIIINDDLDAFTRVPERMGRRAADLESDIVWDIFKLNAAMADGNALFSAAHSNLSTAPAAPSETGLNELRAAMRRQTGLNGAEISLTPAWLFVPPAHETATEKLVASITPDSSANVNPFSSSGRTPLKLSVEPRLETGTNGSLTAWFGTADKNQIDMIELARLSGANGPQISTREGFDVHGLEVKIMHDVGAKAIDHRGLFKNAGA